MYIPKNFEITNQAEIVEFMQRFSFATVVTAKNGIPVATHLPFLVTVKNEKVVLTSHFAKANPHWEDIVDNQVLVIFTEPHAYISPSNYEKELNVPTWNYIAVHAYGNGKLLTGEEETFKVLEATISSYETAYKSQWDGLPADYKLKLSKGIVAFEIEVTALQAKKKLSQNKTETEQKNVISSLSKGDANEKHIAEYMKQNLQ
jgi:transcriptional regulator